MSRLPKKAVNLTGENTDACAFVSQTRNTGAGGAVVVTFFEEKCKEGSFFCVYITER